MALPSHVWDLVVLIRDKQDFPDRTYGLKVAYQVLDNPDDCKVSANQFAQLTKGFSPQDYIKLLRRLIKRSTHMDLAVHNIRTLLAATRIRGLNAVVKWCPNPILKLFLLSVLNHTTFKISTIRSVNLRKNECCEADPNTIACSQLFESDGSHVAGPHYSFPGTVDKYMVFTDNFRSNGFVGQSTIVGRETIPLVYALGYRRYELGGDAFTINLTHGYGYVYVVEC